MTKVDIQEIWLSIALATRIAEKFGTILSGRLRSNRWKAKGPARDANRPLSLSMSDGAQPGEVQASANQADAACRRLRRLAEKAMAIPAKPMSTHVDGSGTKAMLTPPFVAA